MEEFIMQLVEKVGIDEETAKKVVEFCKENAHKIPEWLGESDVVDQIKDKLPGGLGDLF